MDSVAGITDEELTVIHVVVVEEGTVQGVFAVVVVLAVVVVAVVVAVVVVAEEEVVVLLLLFRCNLFILCMDVLYLLVNVYAMCVCDWFISGWTTGSYWSMYILL